tara:strand:- start:267 stop:824 length:558 start_codon:yes stop_codon:yes gene_type:complete
MRIISGYLKGKKIELPTDSKTRPLRDLVKESIFNILKHSNKINCKIENAEVLDLFSGSGSFGLECVSRGAKKVFFVENYNEALKILRINIKNLKCENSSIIIENDCFQIDEIVKKFKNKFDIIFLDPPFKEDKVNFIIEKILNFKILKNEGVMIVHRNKKEDKITKKFNLIENRAYGISKIIFGN